MPVLSLSDLPIAPRNHPWDSSAARQRLKAAASTSTGIDFKQYQKNFLWVATRGSDRLGDYKFPYVDIVNGERMIIPRAIFSATTGARGVDSADIPTEDKAKLKRQINAAYAKIRAKFNDPEIISPFTQKDKDMPDDLLDLQAKYRDKTATLIDEYWAQAKELTAMAAPMSFDDLDRKRIARKLSAALWELGADFQHLHSDIIWQVGAPNLKEYLVKLGQDYAERVAAIVTEYEGLIADPSKAPAIEENNRSGLDEVKDLLKSLLGMDKAANGNVASDVTESPVYLFKDAEGHDYLYGRFTNNCLDREGSILTDAAHKEYIAWLDKHPEAAPELQTWHTEGTGRKSLASWWDYADGFIHMVWPLEPHEVVGIKEFIKEKWIPAMSHGFFIYNIDPDGIGINQYRTFECSLLPKEYAANVYTVFGLLADNKGASNMAFTKAKRRVLVAMHGEEAVSRLEAQSNSDAKSLDEIPVQRREDAPPPAAPVESAVVGEKQLTEIVSGAVAEALKAFNLEAVSKAVSTLETQVVQALTMQEATLEAVNTRLTALENGAVVQRAQQPPQSLDTLAAWVAKQSSTVATESALPQTSDEGATPTGPKETLSPSNGTAPFAPIFTRFPGPKDNGASASY